MIPGALAHLSGTEKLRPNFCRPQPGGPASTPHRISLRLPARLLRLPLKGGSDLEACIRRSSITPPLRGSRREGGARSRAGGGQTPRPVSECQRHGSEALAASFWKRCAFRKGAVNPQPGGPASAPHRISLRLSARLLRLPLKGGVILSGTRAKLFGDPSWTPWWINSRRGSALS